MRLKLTVKTLERIKWNHSIFFIANVQQIQSSTWYINLILFITLNIYLPKGGAIKELFLKSVVLATERRLLDVVY